MEKSEIRQQMQQRRQQIGDRERNRCGRAILHHFAESEHMRYARRFCCFYSMPNEVSTGRIVRLILESGYGLSVPAWDSDSKAYGLFEVTPFTPITIGYKGIREPAVRIPVMPWDVDCFIVPGLAFDITGGRIGYGKGYYDRLLSKVSAATKLVAVCYDWQVFEETLPVEEHDIKMDQIITDKRVIKFR